MQDDLTPSQDWLDNQMISNLSSIFSRYYLNQECKRISKSEIQERVRQLDSSERIRIVKEMIDERHYPPSELTNHKLERYIRLYLNS